MNVRQLHFQIVIILLFLCYTIMGQDEAEKEALDVDYAYSNEDDLDGDEPLSEEDDIEPRPVQPDIRVKPSGSGRRTGLTSRQGVDSRGRRKETNRNCTSDYDCFYGQYCAEDLNLCFYGGDAAYKESCARDGDCIKELKCIAKQCSTLGEEGDFCKAPEHCRANLYCNKDDQVCQRKKHPGQSCLQHEQCLNSLCLEPQKQPRPGAIQRRFNTKPAAKKFCALIGALRNEKCDPFSYHCSIGYVCKPRKQGAPSGRARGGAGGGGAFINRSRGRRPRPRPIGGAFGRNTPSQQSNLGRRRRIRQRVRGKRQADFGADTNDDYYNTNGGQQYDEDYDTSLDDQNYNQYEESLDLMPDEPEPQETHPVLSMPLGDKNRKKIEQRLEKYRCIALSALGTGESCQSSIECRCGEFCSRRGICEPAVCDLGSPGICQVYPGFNTKFQCRNGLCMPPSEDFNEIFRNPLFNPSNSTTTTPASG